MPPTPLAPPYQPDDQRVVAVGSSSVQRAHAVEGTQVHIGTTVLHQKLSQVQVALLAGQVERGGPTACLPVHAAVGKVRFRGCLVGLAGGRGCSNQRPRSRGGEAQHMARLFVPSPPYWLRGPLAGHL